MCAHRLSTCNAVCIRRFLPYCSAIYTATYFSSRGDAYLGIGYIQALTSDGLVHFGVSCVFCRHPILLPSVLLCFAFWALKSPSDASSTFHLFPSSFWSGLSTISLALTFAPVKGYAIQQLFQFPQPAVFAFADVFMDERCKSQVLRRSFSSSLFSSNKDSRLH